MSRTIYESQQYVDGELKSHTKVISSKHDETFGMHRTTAGVDWVFQFTGNEIQMLMVLLELENLDSGIVTIGRLQKEHLISMFKCSNRQFNRTLATLVEKGGAKKLTSTDWMLNPSFFYKGGTKIWKEKWHKYQVIDLPKDIAESYTPREEPSNF